MLYHFRRRCHDADIARIFKDVVVGLAFRVNSFVVILRNALIEPGRADGDATKLADGGEELVRFLESRASRPVTRVLHMIHEENVSHAISNHHQGAIFLNSPKGFFEKVFGLQTSDNDP